MEIERELWLGILVSLGGKGLQRQFFKLVYFMVYEGKRGFGYY